MKGEGGITDSKLRCHIAKVELLIRQFAVDFIYMIRVHHILAPVQNQIRQWLLFWEVIYFFARLHKVESMYPPEM